MMRRQRKVECIVIPVACWILGCVLLLFAVYPIGRLIEGRLHQAIDEGVRQYQVNGEYLAVDNLSVQTECETEEPLAGSTYARLIQQDIALDVPIYYGDNEECLQKGLGQYMNHVFPGEPGEILISGHDSTYLRHIDQLSVGQFITIIEDKKKYYYIITETAVADEADLDSYLINTEEEKLVLYTCYPIGDLTTDRNQRYIIYGKRYIK